MMTKKNYIAIAKAFARANDKAGPGQELRMAAGLIANHCQQDNPNFDSARFLAACGLE